MLGSTGWFRGLQPGQGGHLRPQNAVTYDHRTLSQQNNRRGWGGWGWGGWDDNVPWLAHRHAERWSGLPALGLHTCWPILVGGWDDNVPWLVHRHAERWSGLPALGLHTCWPILVGGGGVGGMITYHKSTTPVLLCTTKYYSVLQSTTRKYYSSTTFYYKVQLQYYSVLLQYYSSPNIVLRLSTQISANAAPANKSDTPTSPNNCACHKKWNSNMTKYCACHEKWHCNSSCGHKRPKLAVTSDQNLRSQATPRPPTSYKKIHDPSWVK